MGGDVAFEISFAAEQAEPVLDLPRDAQIPRLCQSGIRGPPRQHKRPEEAEDATATPHELSLSIEPCTRDAAEM
jgi:hypothetical protein